MAQTGALMSMDYPDYEFIRPESKRLAFVWMVGDRMYYIGLFGAIFIVIAAPLSILFTRAARRPVGLDLFNLAGLGAFVLCIILFLLAPRIKTYALSQAAIKHLSG